jgi:hypothetical protein
LDLGGEGLLSEELTLHAGTNLSGDECPCWWTMPGRSVGESKSAAPIRAEVPIRSGPRPDLPPPSSITAFGTDRTGRRDEQWPLALPHARTCLVHLAVRPMGEILVRPSAVISSYSPDSDLRPQVPGPPGCHLHGAGPILSSGRSE